MNPLRILSLGAGVQSTTIALMASAGEIGPPLDCAIFADTGAEPEGTYEHLRALIPQLSFPVITVSAGNLREMVLDAARGGDKRGSHARPPFFTINEDGSHGMVRRQCTQDFKITPIEREIRRQLGLKPRQRWPLSPVVEQWMGISTDEASRMKPSRIPAITIRWPLIEQGMSRKDCLRWLTANGHSIPPKSACTFCPYHSAAQWRKLRDIGGDDWTQAVELDHAIRHGLRGSGLSGTLFVHRDRVPLDEVDLRTAEEHGQVNLFENECEGLCGV